MASGYKNNKLEDVIINGKPINQWTIEDHNRALDELAAPIYEPFHGIVVEGVGSKPTMLKVRVKDGDGEKITEIVDGLACYSAVPFGHGDPVIVEGVQGFLSRMATIPRSISHSYLGPWLHALADYTGMEMFLPKNGGPEAVAQLSAHGLQHRYLAPPARPTHVALVHVRGARKVLARSDDQCTSG